jgi:hypothetical protein
MGPEPRGHVGVMPLDFIARDGGRVYRAFSYLPSFFPVDYRGLRPVPFFAPDTVIY